MSMVHDWTKSISVFGSEIIGIASRGRIYVECVNVQTSIGWYIAYV